MYHVCNAKLQILSTHSYLFQAKEEAKRLATAVKRAGTVFVCNQQGNVIAGF